MTDTRELLELAALATGGKWHMHDSVTYIDRGGPVWAEWDPLKDDGDSRRLQVALGISLFQMLFPNINWVAQKRSNDGVVRFEASGPCPRLSILKVAAEIGRRMK
jgi:hypothetical protein